MARARPWLGGVLNLSCKRSHSSLPASLHCGMSAGARAPGGSGFVPQEPEGEQPTARADNQLSHAMESWVGERTRATWR